jgi:NitT/TauT family transport system ATP-binding protein
MIELVDLTFAYSGQPPLFADFCLRIGKGEAWAIIGPSGCGKSTLLYLLAGLKRPSQGRVLIAGEPITRPRPRTGLILQDHGLLPWATVGQNARLGLAIRQLYGPDGRHAPVDSEVDPTDTDRQVGTWLRWLGIEELADQYPAQLSRGQRQRTAIARTLVLQPDLLLMDEPFSALDAPIRIELQTVMATFHRQSQLTSITVTHDIEEAVFMGRKVLVLRDGCNRDTEIVDNDLAGRSDQRNRPAFHRRCEDLHKLLERRS